jgi:hypothetical protein
VSPPHHHHPAILPAAAAASNTGGVERKPAKSSSSQQQQQQPSPNRGQQQYNTMEQFGHCPKVSYGSYCATIFDYLVFCFQKTLSLLKIVVFSTKNFKRECVLFNFEKDNCNFFYFSSYKYFVWIGIQMDSTKF